MHRFNNGMPPSVVVKMPVSQSGKPGSIQFTGHPTVNQAVNGSSVLLGAATERR